jgi:hypothetical protein
MASIDINEILNDIRENVRLRRIAGDYPAGLENQLEQEFESIIKNTNRVFSIDVEAREHLEVVNGAFDRLLERYEGQKKIYDENSTAKKKNSSALDPWGFVAPEIIEISHHVLAALRLLTDNAVRQQDADERLVKELSQHVLDRLAVVDHLAIIVQELECRIQDLENQQK